MKAVIVHYTEYTTENGVYLDVIEKGTYLLLKSPMNKKGWKLPKKEIINYIPLVVRGGSYDKKKADLENKAIEWSFASGAANWSYSELAEIGEFFARNGKRYGLIREFRENGII